MLKLIKYELRKNRTALLVLLAVIAAIEAYFLISIAREADTDVIVSLSLLTFAMAASSLAVFIFGVSSYSGELKRKSSYLIFMTPNSTLAVIVSKLLFTLTLSVLFTALTLSLIAVDIPLVAETYGEWEGYFMLFDAMMMQQGVSIHEVLLSVTLTFAQMFLQLLSYVGVAYLAITISATILNSRKGRGFLSFALFCAIVYGLSCISGLYVYNALESGFTVSYVRLLLPSLLQSALVVALSAFLSAWLLKNRVSL